MSRRDAVAKVTGALHRLARTLCTPQNHLLGTIEMFYVYRAQGTPRASSNLPSLLFTRRPQPIWPIAYAAIDILTS